MCRMERRVCSWQLRTDSGGSWRWSWSRITTGVRSVQDSNPRRVTGTPTWHDSMELRLYGWPLRWTTTTSSASYSAPEPRPPFREMYARVVYPSTHLHTRPCILSLSISPFISLSVSFSVSFSVSVLSILMLFVWLRHPVEGSSGFT